MGKIVRFMFFLGVALSIVALSQWALNTEYRGLVYYVVAIPCSLLLFGGDFILFYFLEKKHSNTKQKEH